MYLKPNDSILFYGDSITDGPKGTRDRENPSDLGQTYPGLISRLLAERFPGGNFTFYNQGLSGNRVYDLEERFEKAVRPLLPSVVSILIGVNDTWHERGKGILSPLPAFEACYRRILDRLKKECQSKIVLMEPFLLPVDEMRLSLRPNLETRIRVVQKLAREYQAPLIPLDGLFQAASVREPMTHWATDGIHPTAAGHALIAKAWLETLCGE